MMLSSFCCLPPLCTPSMPAVDVVYVTCLYGKNKPTNQGRTLQTYGLSRELNQCHLICTGYSYHHINKNINNWSSSWSLFHSLWYCVVIEMLTDFRLPDTNMSTRRATDRNAHHLENKSMWKNSYINKMYSMPLEDSSRYSIQNLLRNILIQEILYLKEIVFTEDDLQMIFKRRFRWWVDQGWDCFKAKSHYPPPLGFIRKVSKVFLSWLTVLFSPQLRFNQRHFMQKGTLR